MVRLTDRPDMTLTVYRGRKTTQQQQQSHNLSKGIPLFLFFVNCITHHVHKQDHLHRRREVLTIAGAKVQIIGWAGEGG